MNNLPAFSTYFTGEHALSMTLRDYFAAKAMQGIMSDPNLDMDSSQVARLSYQMADAMMKARPDGL